MPPARLVSVVGQALAVKLRPLCLSRCSPSQRRRGKPRPSVGETTMDGCAESANLRTSPVNRDYIVVARREISLLCSRIALSHPIDFEIQANF